MPCQPPLAWVSVGKSTLAGVEGKTINEKVAGNLKFRSFFPQVLCVQENKFFKVISIHSKKQSLMEGHRPRAKLKDAKIGQTAPCPRPGGVSGLVR